MPPAREENDGLQGRNEMTGKRETNDEAKNEEEELRVLSLVFVDNLPSSRPPDPANRPILPGPQRGVDRAVDRAEVDRAVAGSPLNFVQFFLLLLKSDGNQ